jgi:sugar lactone lactonase YvrE
LYVDVNDTLYVCDQDNNRVQMWTNGSATATTVAGDSGGSQGTNSILLKNPFAVTLDNNGFIYVSDQENNRVQRFSPGSLTGTTVAGQASGTQETTLNGFKNPSGIAIDNSSNIYIADTGNNRLVVWGPNATSGTFLISTSTMASPYGILLVPGSSNQVYVSTQGVLNNVYLWAFNASTPNVTLNVVSGSTGSLKNPSGIAVDPYGNLYVADSGNGQVVMYCVTSTISTVGNAVVGGTGSTPTLKQPTGIGFDSNLNLYVVDQGNDVVVRYKLL